MEKAQDYSFNKSHAACYALISYRTAWLKAHYPCQYMAALISSVMNTKDRVPIYVNACDEMGIEVLPPDVNYSQSDFAVVEGKIRFGLNAVKGVGDRRAQGDRLRARAGRSVRLGLGLRRAHRSRLRQQARARGARQVRRLRLHRRLAQEECSRCSTRSSPGGRSRPPTGSPGRARSSTSPATAPASPPVTIPRSPARSSTSPSCSSSRRRCSASTSRSTRCTRSATSSGARPTARWPSSTGAATARL